MPDRFKQGDRVMLRENAEATWGFTPGNTYVVRGPYDSRNEDYAYWFEKDDNGVSNAWYGRHFVYAEVPW